MARRQAGDVRGLHHLAQALGRARFDGHQAPGFVSSFETVNDKTFRIVLKEPYGLVIDSLAKPGGPPPLMMPKRIAETDPAKQIEEFIGSGPFIFKKDEWKPGDKTVYVRNPDYIRARSRPRPGRRKVVKVDRVEWLAIPTTRPR